MAILGSQRALSASSQHSAARRYARLKYQMPATSIPNLGPKWVSATCEFLTKKNAAEPLLLLVHNEVARTFSGGIGPDPLILSPLIYWNHWVGKNSFAKSRFERAKAKILER